MSLPAIPSIIAGLTEDQIHAYFKEASALVGFRVGYASVLPHFQTWEDIKGHDAIFYVCETCPTLQEAIEKHIAKRACLPLIKPRACWCRRQGRWK